MNTKNGGLYWKDWSRNVIEGWLEVIIHTICCIFIMIFIIFYIGILYHRLGNKKQSGKNISIDIRFNKYLVLSLLCSVIYIYYSYFISVLSVLVFGWRPNYACFYRQIVGIPQCLQRLIAYYFYILRLHTSFNGSIYQLSNTCIFVFISLVTINIISVVIFYTISTYLMNTKDYSFICDRTVLLIVSLFILLCSDTIWSIIFTGIYIKKLMQVMKIFDLNDVNKIRYNVKKLTVLVMTSIISTHLIFIVSFLLQRRFAYQLICIDMTINNICILLSFNIMDDWYKKWCFCYNKCCNKTNNPSQIIQNIEIEQKLPDLSIKTNTDYSHD